MRWYVDVSLLGAEESPNGQGVTVTVEAESWQRALMAARALRGERTPISGFTVEVRDGATRATDPIARMTYVVRHAPVDAELSTFGGLPGDSSADVTAPRKTMSQLSRMVLSPPMASPSTTLVDAQPPPADLLLDASSTGNLARVTAAAPSESLPDPTDPTEPSAKALARALGADDTGDTNTQVADVVVLFRREQEPSPAAPLHYREYVFAVAPGTSEADAELVLRDELARIQRELATVSRGKMVNLAVFDEAFAGPPRVLPLVTLAWKDWRGDPIVDFPRRRGTATPPQTMSFPPPARSAPSMPVPPPPPPARSAPSMPPGAPSSPSVPHAAPSGPQAAPSAPSVTAAARSVPPPPPVPSAPRSGPAIPAAAGSSPAMPGRLRSAPTLLQHGKSAPLPPAAPPSAPSIPQAAASAPALPHAAPSAPKLPEAAPSKPALAAEAPSAPELAAAPPMRPATESDPALPPPAPLPMLIVDAAPTDSEPITQMLPDTADVAVTSVRGPMSSSFPPLGDLPQASPATVNREDTIPPDTMQMPPLDKLPQAPQPPPAPPEASTAAKAPEPLPPMRRQLSSVLPALFEAMHDLAFLRDAVEGAEFCLNLALEQIPASAGVVHLYDMERRVFEAVAVKGERALPRLHDLTPDGDPRFAAAMRATVPPPPLGRSSNPPPPKPSVPVNDGDSVLVPIAKDRRYLGAFELLGPTDGAPLGADEEQALKYIADQYAEFFGSRGYKFGRNSVPRFRR